MREMVLQLKGIQFKIKGESGFASHIIFHLVKSKHNEIATHPEGEFGDLAIECFICGNTNVFVLGFVEVKDGN
jgi:regulator of nonsense transcripts 1